MNIDEMQAGRELDDLIADKVMGWQCGKFDGLWIDTDGQLRGTVEKMPESRQFMPSTDIRAAWEVVEELDLLDMWQGLYRCDNEWTIFDKSELGVEDILGRGETAPLAICRAALKVVME